MNKKTLITLEYRKITDMLAGLASSPMAKESLKNMIPMTDENQINLSLDETNDAVAKIYAKGTVSMNGITDIRPQIKRLEVGSSLGLIELLRISRLLETAAHVKNYYEQTNDSLTAMFESIQPLTPLNMQLKKCIVSEDEVSDEASPALRGIRRRMKNASDKIHTELTRMLNSTDTRNCLQEFVITTRTGRYCLPVKAEYRSKVPGMIHDQSSTGSTIFIEPASVVKLNNDIRELELEEEKEIERILADLSAQAGEYTEELATDLSVLTNLDIIFARAQLSRHFHCTRPVMNTRCYTNIKQGRHPLIEQHKVVPIDIHIGDDFNLLIITGPNTGGKTVSLKTVGLLTLMAQSGLNIPALDHSDIGIFHNIYADIGDEQSIEQSLSTFSSHMTKTVNILKEADDKCLILFDEIGAGTDPTEGAALAIAILSDLHKRGVTTMATTHYSEIKVYALTTPGVMNACCEFDVASLKPTYRLLIGIPGKSNAFAISSKLGLPKYLIDDAQSRLNSEDIKFEDLLTDLEHNRVTIEKERAQIAEYKEETRRLKQQLTDKSKNLDEKTEKILRRANEEAAAILRDAKAYADEAVKAMNKHGMTMKELEAKRSALREKMNKKQEKLKIATDTTTRRKASKPEDFKVGSRVHILSMNVDGDVTSKPDNRGFVNVSIGSLSSKFNIKNLEIVEGYSAPKEKSTKRNASASKMKMSKSASISPEINLIGLTVDEAVAKLDKYLDDAYVSGLPQVRIVHGKGTGALRNGITAYLRGISYVSDFRLGEHGEGDAGVTIAIFK